MLAAVTAIERVCLGGRGRVPRGLSLEGRAFEEGARALSPASGPCFCAGHRRIGDPRQRPRRLRA